jgi:hypothetical protein
MMRSHVNPDPLKTMPAGTGWGMDFQVILDAAAAGEPTSDGTFSWWGIAGTFFLDRSGQGPCLRQDDPDRQHSAPPANCAASRAISYQSVIN